MSETCLKVDTFAKNEINTTVDNGNNTENDMKIEVPKKRRRTTRNSVVLSEIVTVQNLITYHWPPTSDQPELMDKIDFNGELPENYIIQEQVALFLGITSFKRKYPDLQRFNIAMVERNYLLENKYVSEKMCNLGITKLLADDVFDIMARDYDDKWVEYQEYLKEVKRREDHEKLICKKKMELDDESMQKFTSKAVKSAAKFNSLLQNRRLKDHKSYLDFQTFNIHYPQLPSKLTGSLKPDDYAISMVPQQYQNYYKEYTSQELKDLPLKTVTSKKYGEKLITIERNEISNNEISRSVHIPRATLPPILASTKKTISSKQCYICKKLVPIDELTCKCGVIAHKTCVTVDNIELNDWKCQNCTFLNIKMEKSTECSKCKKSFLFNGSNKNQLICLQCSND
ncbi:hypothetical protein A3Q56_01646 [Intoshia linei]|uniref:PHD-type domain-containing protein n=1 Tax=Intoshia linei TaxID=1819745 RepID=A0A177B8D8_9BILA|nr:hypothetical protein A3Q56_01646 [Intoshia linei]